MVPVDASVILARIQFGVAASYHFLFVPLTLGLAWILFTMECLYVKTGHVVYRDMVQFWGKLFGINFAMGVLTGLTLEFQFGTNWAYYSQYVGDVFGTPLAIEGFVAFMLESTFFGLFFFGWNKVSKAWHLFATFCLAFGSSLSALLILIANGFMQRPIGTFFNFQTMRMETLSLPQVFLNPIAQVGFCHTVISGYTTSAIFVLSISAFYILRGRDLAFAKRSFAIAAGFGVVATLMTAFMGDQNGLAVAKYQPSKLAAIEAEWTTQTPPANFNLIAWPNQLKQENLFSWQIPKVLGLIVTHSFNHKIVGVSDIEKENTQRIRRGIIAYDLLSKLRAGDKTEKTINQFKTVQDDLGYGLLLKRYTDKVSDASSAQIAQAAKDTIPNVFLVFWTFRVMVGLGCLFFLICAWSLWSVFRDNAWQKKWLLYTAFYSLPLPWVAALCGWFVTEHGRQPWTVFGMLPTTLSSSSLSSLDLSLSLAVFAMFYTGLFIVEIFLMVKYARLGPQTEGVQ